MTNKSNVIILPTETFSCNSQNSFVREEKFIRRKNNNLLFESGIGKKRSNKINSHLSTKEISPSKYRRNFFFEKMDEVKQYKEDNDKKLHKKCTFIEHNYTMLNTDNSYNNLSDISSLNLNTSREESSSYDDDEYSIEFNYKN